MGRVTCPSAGRTREAAWFVGAVKRRLKCSLLAGLKDESQRQFRSAAAMAHAAARPLSFGFHTDARFAHAELVYRFSKARAVACSSFGSLLAL